ncbi:MAG: hypothetical protein QW267_06290 [Sulfolobales archaeon]
MSWTEPGWLDESLINQLELIALLAITIVVIRYVLGKFITSLVQRGGISIGTKATLIRMIDLVLLSSFLIISVNIVTASLTPYAIVAILGILVLTFFYYEVKQFAAYITLQMFKHVKGRNAEIFLHGYSEPIRGRIVELTPLTSTIEDIFGNKIYIPNTLLIESAIKEHNPSINLRIILNLAEGEDVVELFGKVKSAFKNIDLGPFRFNESHITIKSLDTTTLVIDVRLSAIALPIRNPDVLRILDQLSKSLQKYKPVLEIV